jgi:hypothetical protein
MKPQGGPKDVPRTSKATSQAGKRTMPDNGIGLACRTRLSRETTDKLALAGGYVYRLIAIGDLEVLGDAQSCAVLSELAEYEASGEPFVSILSRGDHGTWGGFQFMELSFEVQIIAERRRSFQHSKPGCDSAVCPKSNSAGNTTFGREAIFSNFRDVSARFCLQRLRAAKSPRKRPRKTPFPNQSNHRLRLLYVPRGTDEFGHGFWLCGAAN